MPLLVWCKRVNDYGPGLLCCSHTFRIQNGNVDGIDLKGRNIVVLFDFRVQQYSMAMLLLDFISMRQLMKANAKIYKLYSREKGVVLWK